MKDQKNKLLVFGRAPWLSPVIQRLGGRDYGALRGDDGMQVHGTITEVTAG